jgi:hypothetical protein
VNDTVDLEECTSRYEDMKMKNELIGLRRGSCNGLLSTPQ